METVNALHIEIQANKNETNNTEQNKTKNKLSEFCLDVAKYIFTGIFLASIFALILKVVWVIFISGILVAILTFTGINLNKIK